MIYAILAIFVLMASGIWYADRNGVMRAEFAAKAHAYEVQRESTEDVQQRSKAATVELAEDLETSRAEAQRHRQRADELEAQVAEAVAARDAAIAAGEEPPDVCRPGCTP